MKNFPSLITFVFFFFSVQPVNAQQKLYKEAQLSETSSSTSPPSTLPVTFTKLSAKVEGKQLIVDWQTASEKNNSYFEVLASADGINFSVIGTVNAKSVGGTSSTALDYRFLTPVSALQLAGFGFLGILLLPIARRRIMKIALLICCVAMMAACAKKKLVDKKENGLVYIQLKQVDLDGRGTMSDIVSYRYWKLRLMVCVFVKKYTTSYFDIP